jgi:hypothetical protein
MASHTGKEGGRAGGEVCRGSGEVGVVAAAAAVAETRCGSGVTAVRHDGFGGLLVQRF